LAEIALVAVAQFDRLVRAGRSPGRHRRAAQGRVLEQHVDLDGGIAAAVEDFAADDVDDGGHGYLAGSLRARRACRRSRAAGKVAGIRGRSAEFRLQLGGARPRRRLSPSIASICAGEGPSWLAISSNMAIN